ncbi:MAG: hypothetical protein B7C24_12785 [Bacteroidetes bacterium 4572_77]|nr:MAG: hypothetical protein B7C24_12785 [Bacteroidetes bacterium 4572_77]
MNNEIVNAENQSNQMINTGTGLAVHNSDTHLSQSGFLYLSGVRKFGDLSIEEDMARGTAVAFLAGVRVYNKDKTLIIDKRVGKGCYYEREKVRLIVKDELLKMLMDANSENSDFDVLKAEEIVDMHLKTAYYSESYIAANQWYSGLLEMDL